MAIIEVSHVTKEFRLGQLHSLKQSTIDAIARLRGRAVSERAPFKALDDVDFSVEPGEVLGIIGHNGAGKSTLLKMLARISSATHGSVKVRGTVAPLIEVGAGLVGDLTGRENIYLNGVILGMRRKEIKKKLDEIVAFAELEQFIDTPIKRYSSGMQVRLGFSIATSIEADILIVDEVLSVGDLAFQRKCFDRMEDLIKRQGKTVLLVSHNIRQIERICGRVILLSKGQLTLDGKPTAVCNRFFEESDRTIQAQLRKQRPSGVVQSRRPSDLSLLDVQFVDSSGKPIDLVYHGQDLLVCLTFRSKRPLSRLTFGLGIHTTDLLYLANNDTDAAFKNARITEEVFEVHCLLRTFPFLPGNYAMRASVAEGEATIFYAENLNPFVVTARTGSRAKQGEQGFIPLDVRWTLQGKHSSAEEMSINARLPAVANDGH